MGLVWSVPIFSGDSDMAWTNGRGKRSIGRGIQKHFW